MVNKMKYAVDRIENNIVVLQNLETSEMSEVNIDKVPRDVKEGSILVLENNEYKLDINEESKRRENLLERFNRLKKK